MTYQPNSIAYDPDRHCVVVKDATSDILTILPSGQIEVLKTFRPEDYGAVGDGVTDDTQALRDCFRAVAAAYGATDEATADEIPSHEDIERWLRDVPGAVARLLPDCDKRKDVIGAIHEAARLAHEIRERA